MDISPLFNASWYLDCNPDVAAAGVDPLIHFIEYGAKEGRDPCPLFATKWYFERYPEARKKGTNPLEHYLAAGALCDPHPLFDTRWYLDKNPDVAASGTNPLVHYRLSDPNQLRSPHPLFDSRWYLATNPDVARARVNPLEHFISFGAAEGRSPNPFFDIKWYLARYPDIWARETNALIHYVLHGADEGRDPSNEFDTKWYLNQNPGVVRANKNPLAHYIHFGRSEGRPALHAGRRAISLAAIKSCLPTLVAIEPALAAFAENQDLRLIDRASGHASGRHYTAWKDLFASLTQPYPYMLFLSGRISAEANKFAQNVLRATQEKHGLQSMLIVITECNASADLNLPKSAHVRILSDLNPQLSASDRADIVKTMIYYLRPNAVLNVDSGVLWSVFAERGAALRTVSRLFAALVEDDFLASDSALKMNIESAAPYLSGIYSPIAVSQGTPVAKLITGTDLQRRFTSEKLLQDMFLFEGNMCVGGGLTANPAVAAPQD